MNTRLILEKKWWREIEEYADVHLWPSHARTQMNVSLHMYTHKRVYTQGNLTVWNHEWVDYGRHFAKIKKSITENKFCIIPLVGGVYSSQTFEGRKGGFHRLRGEKKCAQWSKISVVQDKLFQRVFGLGLSFARPWFISSSKLPFLFLQDHASALVFARDSETLFSLNMKRR